MCAIFFNNIFREIGANIGTKEDNNKDVCDIINDHKSHESVKSIQEKNQQ